MSGFYRWFAIEPFEVRACVAVALGMTGLTLMGVIHA